MTDEPPISTTPAPGPEDWPGSDPVDAIHPSSCGGSGCAGALGRGPVFALGTIDYDLVSEARSDSIRTHMGKTSDPRDPSEFLAYLKANPWEAASVTWILRLDQSPIYAVRPGGPFAARAFETLAGFLADQVAGMSELVSIPGTIRGRAALFHGQVVDVIEPELRGMYNWKTKVLVAEAVGTPEDPGPLKITAEGVTNFLHRVYYELRNLGVTPGDRAINFAATNAIQAADVFRAAASSGMELDAISVERSPICRPGSDCWDVKMMFFHPDRPAQAVRRSYRFTVDVSDVVPVMVGPVRSWSIR